MYKIKIPANTWILIFVLLAFALRLAYVLTLPNSVSWVDEQDYLQLSQKMVNFHEYSNSQGTPTAFRPLGYPLFLALLALLHIKSLLAIRIAQVVLSLLNLFVLLRLLHLQNQPKAAPWAALIFAIYPYFIMLPGTVLASTWFSFLLLCSTWMLLRAVKLHSWWRILLAGLLMSLATLTRTSAGVLAAVMVFWMFWQFRWHVGKTFKFAIIFSLAFLLLVLPWAWRNQQQLGAFALSTNGGRNLWLGNNAQTTVSSGSNIPIPPELDAVLLGKTEVQTDSVYSAVAKKYIREHPWQFAARTLRKGLSLWRFGPSPTTPGYVEQNKLYALISYFSYGPIFLLALAGFFLARAENRRMMMLYIFYMIIFTILHGVYFSKVRFRLPLDHFLIIMAASGLQTILHKFFHQHEVNSS